MHGNYYIIVDYVGATIRVQMAGVLSGHEHTAEHHAYREQYKTIAVLSGFRVLFTAPETLYPKPQQLEGEGTVEAASRALSAGCASTENASVIIVPHIPRKG